MSEGVKFEIAGAWRCPRCGARLIVEFPMSRPPRCWSAHEPVEMEQVDP